MARAMAAALRGMQTHRFIQNVNNASAFLDLWNKSIYYLNV
jgi:hypothetical protein